MRILLKNVTDKMLKVLDFKQGQLLAALFLSLVLCTTQAYADSDGKLQLDTTTITNQANAGSGNSDFAIRSELFTNSLTQKVQEKNQTTNQVTSKITNVTFEERQENTLYKADYRPLQAHLFKNYQPVTLTNSETKKASNNFIMLLMIVLSVPLFVVTGFVARWFARRKTR